MSSFNSVWSDLDLEQSVVKDSKSRKGGIIVISRQEQASLKWYLTIHLHSAMLSIFKEFCGVSEIEENVHRTLKPSMIPKDEEEINKMINVILDRSGNPFAVKIRETEEQEQKDPLINIAAGVVASAEATKGLLGARKTKETCLINYVKERLNSDQLPMSSPNKQLQLKTFATT